MPEKGKTMSQTFYDKQNRLLVIYQKLFTGKEMDEKDTVKSLKMIGFSEIIAVNKIRNWAEDENVSVLTGKEINKMLKERTSLEKYVLQMSLGRKNYIRFMFRENKLTRDEALKMLISTGCKEEAARDMISEWEERG